MNYSFENPYELVKLERYSNQENIIFSKRVIKSGHEIPVHWHDFNEIEIVVSGSARHIMNGIECQIFPGSAYLMSSCDFHGISVIKELTMLNLSFAFGSIDPVLESCFGCGIGNFSCHLSNEKAEHIKELFDSAFSENENRCFSRIMKRNLAEELIITLIREAPGKLCEDISPLVHKAIVKLNEGFRSHISLAEIAEMLYVSPNYLGSRFKESVGMSFNRYLNMTRLRFACGQLAASKKTVKEISAESGFESCEYFTSVFKKHFGMTPSEWRLRGQPSE